MSRFPRTPSRDALQQPRHRTDRLARAVRQAAARWRAPRTSREAPPDRLALLEDDLREVRTRVNALFFAVIAVGLSDLVGRLLA